MSLVVPKDTPAVHVDIQGVPVDTAMGLTYMWMHPMYICILSSVVSVQWWTTRGQGQGAGTGGGAGKGGRRQRGGDRGAELPHF